MKGHARFSCFVVMASIMVCLFTPIEAHAKVSEPAASADSTNPYATQQNWYEALGERYRLLDTYTDPDAALEQAMADDPMLVGRMSDAGYTSGMTSEDAVGLEDRLGSLDISDDFVLPELRFADTYGSQFENLETQKKLVELNEESTVDPASLGKLREYARMLLPSLPENGNVPSLAQVIEDDDRTLANINKAGADDYAIKHCGVNKLCPYNRDEFDVDIDKDGHEVDCTNFASQILFKSSSKFMDYDNYDTHFNDYISEKAWNKLCSLLNDEKDKIRIKGWWDINYVDGNKTKRLQSDAWCNANVFMGYWHSGYGTLDYSELKKNVRHGDFVGIDWTGNGSVDHIVYVLAVGPEQNADGSLAKDKDGKLIRSLTIAQHSSEFCPRNLGSDENLANATERYKDEGQTRFYRVGR